MVVECQGMVYGITNSYNLENAAVDVCVEWGFLVMVIGQQPDHDFGGAVMGQPAAEDHELLDVLFE